MSYLVVICILGIGMGFACVMVLISYIDYRVGDKIDDMDLDIKEIKKKLFKNKERGGKND